MRALLDTHALLWWLAGDKKLSAAARAVIQDESNEILVSAATAWEISTKVRLGKLPGAAAIVTDLADHTLTQGFIHLDVSFAHGVRAGLLPGPHRDPFDRMLIAQAQAEDVALMSNETVFDAYGVRRIW